MGANTEISWTDDTVNPWWGCVKVSPGCDNCYAANEDHHWHPGDEHWGKDAERLMVEGIWENLRKWNRAAKQQGRLRTVFVGSMCDVMEDRRDLDAVRDRLYQDVERYTELIFIFLTKRPQNYRRLLPAAWLDHPLPNVWLMTTVELPEYLWRINELKAVPAVVHGLSLEPLLGPMPTLHEYLDHIEWVIVGGESQSGARAMHPDWARSVRDQCVQAGVAFHFKQWGEHDSGLVRIGRKAAGRVLDGLTWDQMPEPK